jgi:hypothetical protein
VALEGLDSLLDDLASDDGGNLGHVYGSVTMNLVVSRSLTAYTQLHTRTNSTQTQTSLNNTHKHSHTEKASGGAEPHTKATGPPVQ